jgi:uncharacterized repeat protein (TIGR01451 family)
MRNLGLPLHPLALARLLAVALLLAVPLQLLAFVAGAQGNGILYVDGAAGPGGDGSSWATAFHSLQDALAVAAPGDQVWLGAGIYRPLAETAAGDPRSATFYIASGVSLYGGFAPALGIDTWDARDPATHRAVLSGDLGGDDVDRDGDGIIDSWHDQRGDNAYHVLYLDGAGGGPLGRDTVLDGLVVTAGHAGGPSAGGQGGGIYCAGAGGECSPTLSNLLLAGNQAITGGGIYNDGGGGVSSPLLRGVSLRRNHAAHDGGGMFNNGILSGDSSPLLIDVTFEANVAGYGGGGLLNYGYQGHSSPTLLNVSFYGNRAGTWGGGILSCAHYGGTSNVTLVNGVFAGNQAVWGGGGMHNSVYGGSSTHTVVNATFAANQAERGGGLYSENELGRHSLTLANSILWGNTAAVAGAQAHNVGAAVTISHSNLQGSGGSAAWNTSLGTDGGGNLDLPPIFVREPDPGDGDWITTADNDYGDLRLDPASGLVDAGDNGALPADEHDLDGDGNRAEALPIDRAGNPRLTAASPGQPAVVDMGAYEAAALVSDPEADLSLSAFASRSSVFAGETLVYHFAISNHGPDDASQVILVANLSPAASFQSASPGCLAAGDEVTCVLASLAAGTGITYQVTVNVAAGVAGALVHTARCSAAELDPNPEDNEVTVATQLGAARFLAYLPLVTAP